MDLILYNGRIISMDTSNPEGTAVAVKDGMIVKVGEQNEVLLLRSSETELIDLQGKMLVPGFNDSHMHLLSFGYSLQKVNLAGTSNMEELIDRTKSFADSKGIGLDQWILGRGWNNDHFDVKNFPTRYDLDKISTENPICLTRACGHVSIVNSRALELCGINRDTRQVDGGHFDLDEKGEPLGIFKETAMQLIYDNIPAPDIEEIKAMIIDASHRAVAEGITSIQSDDFEALPCKDFNKVIQAYTELKESKELPLRIYEQCLLPSMDRLQNFLDQGYHTGYGDEYFKIGPLKLLGDGSLGARTAYLCQPYADDPSTSGIPVFTQEELDLLVVTAHNAGMHVAIHCIGDKIMYMAFESIEKAQQQNPRKDHRHSIIHCQITDEVLLDKYRDLDVIAHVQPIFIDYDLHMVASRVGEERSKTTYNWKSLLDRGVHVACGSDCPVEPFNVLPTIYTAVTRKDLKGYPENGWLPYQKLTVEEALHCFTAGAAYASFEEEIKGSLAPGKLADMVLLSQDLYEIHPDHIKDVQVEMTFVGGKLVYQR